MLSPTMAQLADAGTKARTSPTAAISKIAARSVLLTRIFTILSNVLSGAKVVDAAAPFV